MEDLSQQGEPTRSGNPDKKKAKEDQNDNEELGLRVKKPGSKAQGRKRTKTGCLTCRRRRIKCGEERPTCQNCTKSKRQCEGYNQRVVFKDPLNTYRGPPIPANVQFTEPVVPSRRGDPFQQSMLAGGPLPIAPKPAGSFVNSIIPPEIATHLPAATSPGIERKVYGFTTDSAATFSKQRSRITRKNEITADTVDHSHLPDPRPTKPPGDLATHYDFEALEPVKQESDSPESSTSTKTAPLEWSAGPNTSATFYRSYPSPAAWHQPLTSPPIAPPLSVRTNSSILPAHMGSANSSSGVSLRYEDAHSALSQDQRRPSTSIEDWNWEQPILNQMPSNALGDDDDDPYDPYDVSDEDQNMEDDGNTPGDLHLMNNDLGVVVALQARQDNRNLAIRSITSYIDRPDMLATYTPSPQTSPLQDPMCARIFCHFINVTGPTISMFERHPANPSLIFQGRPIPRSMQHNWTYTFPTLALHNQGLLHAMLALASLHIAKLQNGPITASLKHYAYSLRKIGKSVSVPHKRRHPATLAATMLLAFYECWCADHQKWTNHLLGAKMLVREIDFAGVTKHLRSVKLQQHREERAMDYQAQQQGYQPMYDERNLLPGATEDVDENIVSMLMGKKLRYDQYGRIIEDYIPDDGAGRIYTERDIATYETQRDLFWWYCKNDAYQSILGGGRLFMDFERWSHCPPRAPLGRLNATYGTFDHLVLLMGRLADFASKDVKRKKMVMKVNGGYRPPGMSPQGQAPQQGQQPQQSSPQSQSQMPPFSGMMPGMGEATLPMGFASSRDQSPQSTQSFPSDETDLDALRIEAEEEWQEIRNAFNVIEDHFGDDFQALGPEFSTPIQTPFGFARQYRTYGIAGIWLNYYMALITCHRAHPSMPPAAMIASGVAARHTESFANEIGRIAAGIAPDCSMTAEVSPGVGAALIESTTPMFIAGVQYQNAAQRNWTVNRLRDIARLTGWQTSHAIITGIETSWTKAAEVGRGPPYVRTGMENHDRIIPDIWHTARRLDFALLDSNPERRLVIRQTDRAHYALGILGLESDYGNVEVNEADD